MNISIRYNIMKNIILFYEETGEFDLRKKKKPKIEFRYYRIPEGRYILALLGKKWIQNYGRNIDYLHFHNYLEIGYCYEGRGTVTLGEEDYSFEGTEFTVIPKNFLHTTNSASGNVSRWEYLFLDMEGFLQKIYGGDSKRAEQMIRKINSRAVFYSAKKSPKAARKIRQILDIMRRTEPFYEEEAEGILLSLFAELARMNGSIEGQKEDKTPEGGQRLNHVISRSLDYISDHIDEPLKIRDIAEYCHISETHFRRQFSDYMNMSPLEYINLARIRTACEYLKKTDESVGIIAAKCGFSTNSTFNRNFLQIMGVTPVQWRKRPENYEQQILKYEIHSEEGW